MTQDEEDKGVGGREKKSHHVRGQDRQRREGGQANEENAELREWEADGGNEQHSAKKC